MINVVDKFKTTSGIIFIFLELDFNEKIRYKNMIKVVRIDTGEVFYWEKKVKIIIEKI